MHVAAHEPPRERRRSLRQNRIRLALPGRLPYAAIIMRKMRFGFAFLLVSASWVVSCQAEDVMDSGSGPEQCVQVCPLGFSLTPLDEAMASIDAGNCEEVTLDDRPIVRENPDGSSLCMILDGGDCDFACVLDCDLATLCASEDSVQCSNQPAADVCE